MEGHKEHCHPGATHSKCDLEGHKEYCHPDTNHSKFDLEGHKEHCHPGTTHSKCVLEGHKEHCHPGATHSKCDWKDTKNIVILILLIVSVFWKYKIQKNWCTVTVAPTIEHHDGHSRTPANHRWDQVPGRSKRLLVG